MNAPGTSSAETDLTPNIRHKPGLTLSEAEIALLGQAFVDSNEVFVEHEFRSGYSGAVVLQVSPGPGQAQVVVKLGPPTDLEREYTAYRQLVEPASPQNTARLQGAPLLAGDGQLALLSYTFAGGDPRLPTHSLEAYFNKQGGQSTAEVLDRVFRIYGRQWWGINRPQKFVVAEQYDRLLHVHLKFKLTSATEAPSRTLVAGQFGIAALRDLQSGQHLRLQDFTVAEVRPDKSEVTLTANPPAGEASPPLRLRLETDQAMAYQLGDQVETLDVVITATRQTLLAEAACMAISTFDPDAPSLNLSGRIYPNPLHNLSDLLDQVIEARVSTIHGDLNLQNILVDETTGFAWLIDFAETRSGPTLYDLQRLEGQIITKLLPPVVAQADLGPEVIVALYEALHADPPRQTAPHTALQGAYTLLVNLRRLARQYLMDDRDWDEYYLGLVITLLGTLKFRGLDPPAHGLALLGAMAARNLMRTPIPTWERRLSDWDVTGYRVLVVEDNPMWQEILQESLTDIGCLVEVAGTFGEARQKLQGHRFNLVTIDAHLGRELETQEGILLLNYVRNHVGTAVPVIIISGEIAKRDVVRAFTKFSVANVLLKEHFDYDEFREAVREALLTAHL